MEKESTSVAQSNYCQVGSGGHPIRIVGMVLPSGENNTNVSETLLG